MVTEIMAGLYKIDIPLPKSPLKSLNAYMITDKERPLIIDTGFDQKECRDALFTAMNQLGVHAEHADVLITHMHPDHSGLVAELAGLGARPYCSREDAEIFNMPRSRAEFFQQYLRQCGFPDDVVLAPVLKQPSFLQAREPVTFHILEDGDEISTGGFQLRCLITPGHTPGHLCLYDEQKKLLFSGDHILKDITPNISWWREGSNPLQDFVTNLMKISELEVDLVLPGHRSVFCDCSQRIAELIKNHENRADEVVDILRREQPLTARQIAGQMTWNLSYPTFEDFPLAQQLFATGEAMAHVCYLEGLGKIIRKRLPETFIFYLA